MFCLIWVPNISVRKEKQPKSWKWNLTSVSCAAPPYLSSDTVHSARVAQYNSSSGLNRGRKKAKAISA